MFRLSNSVQDSLIGLLDKTKAQDRHNRISDSR